MSHYEICIISVTYDFRVLFRESEVSHQLRLFYEKSENPEIRKGFENFSGNLSELDIQGFSGFL